MKNISLLFFFLTYIIQFSGCDVLENKPKEKRTFSNHHYEITSYISPSDSTLQATSTIYIINEKDSCDRLKFYLHKDLQILWVSGENIEGYRFDKHTASDLPECRDAGYIYIGLIEPVHAGETIELSIAYEGSISVLDSSLNYSFDSTLVELNHFACWYPKNPDYEPFTFVHKTGKDSLYKIVGTGECKFKDSVIVFSEYQLADEIFFAASKDLVSFTTKKGALTSTTHARALADSTIKDVSSYVLRVYRLLQEWFGGNEVNSITVFIPQRETGDSFTSEKLMVIKSLTDSLWYYDQAAIVKNITRELSNNWWKNDNKDWISIGVAEMSSLLMVKHLYGDEVYEAYIDDYRKKGGNQGSFSDYEPDTEQGVLLANRKAPLLFHSLIEKIGEKEFLTCSKIVLMEDTVNSDIFLQVLQEKQGEEVRRSFESLLE